jgi:uncharacterized protein
MKTTEITIEDKLRDLYNLQLIHSRLDDIRNTRGDLPLEVRDLKDEISGLEVRIQNIKTEQEELVVAIKAYKEKIKSSEDLIKKYTKQQDNVRNNREFEAITKEIEFQGLEIQLSEKRIREGQFKIENKEQLKLNIAEKLDALKNHLKHKDGELETIIQETNKEETILLGEAEKFEKLIEPRLLNSYQKIRQRAVNGLAIVPVERGAAQGSYFTIPPQVQLEIAQRKKIVVDEHSGRILIDAELAMNQKEKMLKLIGK